MAATSPRKRTHCFFNQEPVDVKVGPEEKIFRLYPSILSTNSKVFQKALSDNWRHSAGDTLNFTFLNVQVFDHYINWCHLGDLDLIFNELGDDQDDNRCVRRCHTLAKIYIMADILEDKVLRNAAMNKILECAASKGYQPGDQTISLAFSSLPETSTLCRFMIDDGLSGISDEWLKEWQDNLPQEYLDALLFGWARRSIDASVEFAKPENVDRCTYHEHDEDLPAGETCARIASKAANNLKGGRIYPLKTSVKRRR